MSYEQDIENLTSSPPSASRPPLMRKGRGFLRRSGGLRLSRFGGFLFHRTG